MFKRKPDLPFEGFQGGFIESPVDYRDVAASSLVDEKPIPAVHAPEFPLRVKDQGPGPFCVGEAGSTIMEYLTRKAGGDIEFDGEWLYRKCKEIDGLPGVAGTYYRSVLKVLQKQGAKPVGGTEADAAKYKIGGYAQVIDLSPEGIRRAIYKFGAVLMGFRMYAGGSWQNAYIKVTSDRVVATHATVGKGYDTRYLTGQNSFGINWGDKGDFYVPDGYMPYEAWVATDAIPPELLPDPSKKPKYVFARQLFQGMSGDDVEALHDALVFYGCMTASEVATGPDMFGPRTRAAVAVFQARHGITQTGNFGPVTLAKLNELLA